MPRRRTSNRPIRRRIRLETQQDVQSELGKVYRAVDAGTMSPAEGTRRVFILDKLRASGLPDARSRAGNIPSTIQILSVPSRCFLSQAQIEAQERGGPIVDINQCTPKQLEHNEPITADDLTPLKTTQLIEHQPQQDISVGLEPQSSRETQLLAELNSLTESSSTNAD